MVAGDVDRGQVVGRRVLEAGHVLSEDGKERVLVSAFVETRPGGLSVDVLWAINAAQAKQASVASSAAQVAQTEGHAVEGWALFTVRDAVATRFIDAVRHSPSASNPKHADVYFQRTLAVTAQDSKRDAEIKAWSAAKWMAEFHAEHGTFVRRP